MRKGQMRVNPPPPPPPPPTPPPFLATANHDNAADTYLYSMDEAIDSIFCL